MRLPVTPTLPLRTRRLVLRPFRPADRDALLTIQSDAEAVRYVPYGPRTPGQIGAVLARKVAGTTLVRDGDLLEVAVTADDNLVGDVLLALRSAEHETLEVGYLFARAVWGRGYATEAVSALLDLAFGELGARRVVARVDDRNAASLALLDRLGLRREAHLVENEWVKGELVSEVDFAVLAREWLSGTRSHP